MLNVTNAPPRHESIYLILRKLDPMMNINKRDGGDVFRDFES